MAAHVTGLRIAVPRGALFGETLDLLDRIGLDTREVRENDRKLLFEDVGIITMRPSDVPTYVEAGAADIGITGKDVLMEQSEREVYELVDLGYGRCQMVLAGVAGEDRAAEALRRLGVVRIATKYPRIATAHFLTPAARRRSSRSRDRSSWRRSPVWWRRSSTSPPPGRLCARTVSWSARRSPCARRDSSPTRWRISCVLP